MMASDRLNWIERRVHLLLSQLIHTSYNLITTENVYMHTPQSRVCTFAAICIQPIHKYLCHIVKWISIWLAIAIEKLHKKPSSYHTSFYFCNKMRVSCQFLRSIESKNAMRIHCRIMIFALFPCEYGKKVIKHFQDIYKPKFRKVL